MIMEWQMEDFNSLFPLNCAPGAEGFRALSFYAVDDEMGN